MADLELPHLGEGVTEARVVRWLKREGELVQVDEPVVEVETDKVAAELPSPVSGVLASILVDDDRIVPIGTVIARFTPTDRPAAPSSGPAGGRPDRSARTAGLQVEKPTPAVRALAAELGVDLSAVVGTGPRGRITLGDVRSAAAAAAPLPPSMETLTWRARSRDGTEIGGAVSGSGPPLLLVHGMASDHGTWTSAARILARRFTVYAIDRRGRGLSGDHPIYSLERERDDLIEVVAAIGGPVDVVAHSYGALCALEAAREAGGIRRLVLYEPPVGASLPLVEAGLVARLRGLLDEGRRDDVLARFLADALWQTPGELDLQRRRPDWAGRVQAAHTVVRELAAVDAYALRPPRFQTMQTPTLLMVGALSRLGVAASAFELAGILPRSWIAVLPGQAHLAMIRQPERFAERLLEFLR